MDADLDLLLTAVYVTADDLLPARPGNARRSVTDAEVVTLCVAQAIMGIQSDRRFLAVASKYLRHLFPRIPGQAGYYKRRRRLTDTLEWLMGVFASQSPGIEDDLLLIDSTPVECARSRETVKRSQLADAADYGYCASHSRFFWGFRLHALCSPDGTPRAIALTSPKLDEREVALKLLARAKRQGAVTVIGDKGYAGKEFATKALELQATIVRPHRKDEPGRGPHLAPIRQRIESIFWTCKDILTLERHGARTLPGLRERILQRLLTLTAAITLAWRRVRRWLDRTKHVLSGLGVPAAIPVPILRCGLRRVGARDLRVYGEVSNGRRLRRYSSGVRSIPSTWLWIDDPKVPNRRTLS